MKYRMKKTNNIFIVHHEEVAKYKHEWQWIVIYFQENFESILYGRGKDEFNNLFEPVGEN